LLIVMLSRVPPLRRPWSAPPWLLQARDALSTQGARTRLRDLAGELGVHPVHLSRAFAAQYGITMSEYRRGQRIAQATHLLANGHESITRIAYACGFVDQAHLTRAFKQATGVTPAIYRARARQTADYLHDGQA
jgi:AraC family transcriptional regulator